MWDDSSDGLSPCSSCTTVGLKLIYSKETWAEGRSAPGSRESKQIEIWQLKAGRMSHKMEVTWATKSL